MIRVLELFAGIGACSKALTNLGIEHEIVDAVEIDKYAVKSFNAIHGTNFGPKDITKYDATDLGEIGLIMHGSPCQDFSVAGRNAGGDEGSGTRSSLLYETIRIVEQTKPKVVIWENVKNLLSKKHIHNFRAYIDHMTELGYHSTWRVLNAKDFGIPQNRERVFTISTRQPIDESIFPNPEPLTNKLKDILEDNPDERYFLTDEQVASFKADSDNQTAKGYGFAFKPRSTETYATTISTRAGQRKTDNFVKIVGSNGYRIRKLTPRECWRLMGFDDADFDKAQATGMSNTQLYKQAGNSIVVNVLEKLIANINAQGFFEDKDKSLIEQVDELSEEQLETILRRINELQEKIISESKKEDND